MTSDLKRGDLKRGDVERGDVERGGMRAADADRTIVAQRLQVAVDEGRLGLSDYDERLQAAYAARTYAELERVTADLPAPAVDQVAVARQEKDLARRHEWSEGWRSWAGAALVMIAIWGATSLVSGTLLPFWPAIPLGIWAAVVLASALGGSRKGCGR